MPPQPPVNSPPGVLPALWWGWIAPPVWWLTQFEARYAVLPWAEKHGQRWLVSGVGVAALAGALALLGWSVQAYRRGRGEQPAAFLRAGGVGLAALSALLVLGQLLPDLFLGPGES